MKRLNDILAGVTVEDRSGPDDPEVRALQFDSRRVEPGDCFVAVRGTRTDGHAYLEQARAKGAGVLVTEEAVKKAENLTVIRVADTARALGEMAANWYGNPSRDMQVVGVTGTNGKTSVVTLLHRLVLDMGFKAGMISTVENRIGDTVIPATHTTPDQLQLQRLLGDMRDAGCDYVFMEASSHAIDQRRITGIRFAGAVFTNLSHDHLDYHGTYKAYIYAKKQLFDDLPQDAFALVNADDRQADVMLQNTAAENVKYGLRKAAKFRAKVLENNLTGLILEVDGREVHTKLVGRFNAYNALAAYGAARMLNLDEVEVLTALSRQMPPAGRFEMVRPRPDGPSGIVDYAHTPDALENVLSTISDTRAGGGMILTVVGCGGDRDRGKRPEMAQIAARLSDRVILTSDNPRTENPDAIIADMQQGILPDQRSKVLVVSDRREAIRTAAALAQTEDVVLVAGKGHETYQEINGVRYPFDDRKVLTEALENKR